MAGGYMNHYPPGSGYSNPPAQQYGYAPPYGSQPQPAPNALGHNAALPIWPQQQTRPPPPTAQSGTRNGQIFSLHIEQQPDRARMCGFGDKDRRPITPPPCVKLLIKEEATGKEVKVDTLRAQHYILMVDIYDRDGEKEVNLVRHTNAQPSVSISMATPTSYPPSPEQPQVVTWMTGNGPAYSYAPPNWAQSMPSYGGVMPQGYSMPQVVPQPPHSSNMFTRNLIGSVTVSAQVLEDLDKKTGVWFVLQDLSVRQEGTFRLKMSFLDAGGPTPGTVNMSSTPILATTFSEPFNVWSAKKFPGVKESTALSKHFAQQGVKIPIRKDTNKGNFGAGDDGDDD